MKKVMAILVALSFVSATTLAQVQPAAKKVPATETKTTSKTITKKSAKKITAKPAAKKNIVNKASKKTVKKVEVK